MEQSTRSRPIEDQVALLLCSHCSPQRFSLKGFFLRRADSSQPGHLEASIKPQISCRIGPVILDQIPLSKMLPAAKLTLMVILLLQQQKTGRAAGKSQEISNLD